MDTNFTQARFSETFGGTMKRKHLKVVALAVLALFALPLHSGLCKASTKLVILNGQKFTSEYSDVNGIAIHYVIGGHGPAIVLLHGYPETWYDWRKVMPILAAHYTIIAPDMRGLGDSGKPGDGDYTKKSVADDIYKLTQDLGYQKVYLVGQDMGGPVAVSFAGSHPDSVIKMVFIESAIPGYGLEAAMDTAHGGSWHFGLFADTKIALLLTKGREKEFFTAWAYRGKYVVNKATFSNADIDEYVMHYAAPGGMAAGFGYYKAFAQDAVDDKALFATTKLTFPILAVAGDHSFGKVPFESVSLIGTNVQGVIMKNCGHFVNEEKPKELSALILQFFTK